MTLVVDPRGAGAPFETLLADSWPPEAWGDARVVTALSGGADSVALLVALARLRRAGGGRLLAAHFNHALRGAESDADEAFVRGLCLRLDVPLDVGRADSGALAATPDGLEAAARHARYRFLADVAARHGARYLVTAHTADDQAETILHHILRGTGLAGLAGMSRARLLNPSLTLLRPMLTIRRRDVEAYLAALDQSYCVDATNADPALTRSRIRHKLLPLLEREFNADVVSAILRLGRLAAESHDALEPQAERLLDAALCRGDPVELDCGALSRAAPHLTREALVALWRRRRWPVQSMGFAEWDALAELALVGGPTRMFPGGLRVERRGARLLIASPRDLDSA